MEQQVIVIVGPTCSGKTSLAVNLAKELDTEIISADSRQIFKYLTIGTAKPNLLELSQVKHHFIDFLYPDEDYNVGLYERDATKIIGSLAASNKIPIIVGGSGLYIKAVIDGIVDVDSDDELREELKQIREEFGNEFLYNELKKIDPSAAETMLPSNWKRVIRAIEVFKLTGKSILEIHNKETKTNNYNFLQFGLNWPRQILYKNIEARVDQMIENGLVDEVKSILEMNYSKKLNSLNTVGYKEIISYLDNEISLERAVELIKRNTRRYAKRQLTWFRKDERIKWFDLESFEEIEIIKNKILKSIT
ncbi:MAG: tRNA (adenosine(37)-N6)-dimethylallyltransferase MiaA [Melioribacteraceae bacterium]|nr:MAG: tRNA (adenosine(37)-N6)-dimethylallyltransferase MiaA [Melioribacteraceae bacterium]